MSILATSTILGFDSEKVAAFGTVAAVAVAALVAVVTAAAGIWRIRTENRRGRRSAMTDAHSRMTSGEVATARDIAGQLAALPEAERAEFVDQKAADLIRAFYQLCWSIEYVANVRRTWLGKRRDQGQSEFLKWNEEAVYFSAESIRNALVRRESSFADSSARGWTSIQKIARVRGLI